MDCETQAAFEASNVVLEEVGVFVEVDGLQRKLSETLASVGIARRLRCDTAAAELGAGAVLQFVSDSTLNDRGKRTW